MVRLNFLIKIQTKLKLGIVNFFIGDEPDQLCRKNVLFLLQFYLEVFYWFWGFFYVLTYYFYQILGNAPLIVKIHHKNTLFLSTITKQYFFFYNFYYYFITELSTSIKYIDKISN